MPGPDRSAGLKCLTVHCSVSPCPCGTLMGWSSRAGPTGRPISAPLYLQAAPRPGGDVPPSRGPHPPATRPYGPRGVNILQAGARGARGDVPSARGPLLPATGRYGPRGVSSHQAGVRSAGGCAPGARPASIGHRSLRPVWRHPHRAGAHDAGNSTPARGPPLSATGSHRSPGPSPHRAGVSASPYGGPGPDCAAGGPAPMGTDHGAT